MASASKLARQLKPYILAWQELSSVTGNNITTLVTESPGEPSGGMIAHDLDGQYHTGTLAWGKVSKVGSDISDIDQRNIIDLQVTGGTDDVISVGAGSALRSAPGGSDGSGGNVYLRSDANGDLLLHNLELFDDSGITFPQIDFESGGAGGTIRTSASNGLELMSEGDVFMSFNGLADVAKLEKQLVTDQIVQTDGYNGLSTPDAIHLNFGTGVADIWDLHITNLYAEKFIAAIKEARIGNITLAHTYALLAGKDANETEFTIPPLGGYQTMYIRDVPGADGGINAFSTGDRLLINYIRDESDGGGGPLDIGECYFAIVGAPQSTVDGNFVYFTVRYLNVPRNVDKGANVKGIPNDAIVVNLGEGGTALTPGDGIWEASVADNVAGGPYSQIKQLRSPDESTLNFDIVLRTGFLGGLARLGGLGASHTASTLGLWFRYDSDSDGSYSEEDPWVELNSYQQAMRNVNFSLYTGSERYLWMDPDTGLNLLPVSTQDEWGHRNAISFWNREGSGVRSVIALEDRTNATQYFYAGLNDIEDSNVSTFGVFSSTNFTAVGTPVAGIRFTDSATTNKSAIWSDEFEFLSEGGRFRVGDGGGTYYADFDVWGGKIRLFSGLDGIELGGEVEGDSLWSTTGTIKAIPASGEEVALGRPNGYPGLSITDNGQRYDIRAHESSGDKTLIIYDVTSGSFPKVQFRPHDTGGDEWADRTTFYNAIVTGDGTLLFGDGAVGDIAQIWHNESNHTYTFTSDGNWNGTSSDSQIAVEGVKIRRISSGPAAVSNYAQIWWDAGANKLKVVAPTEDGGATYALH